MSSNKCDLGQSIIIINKTIDVIYMLTVNEKLLGGLFFTKSVKNYGVAAAS